MSWHPSPRAGDPTQAAAQDTGTDLARAGIPRRRDRRGRGARGPEFEPNPLTRQLPPAARSRSARFDSLAAAVLDDIESRNDSLPPLDLAVEDVPILPEQWAVGEVPLSALVPATVDRRARIVLFRRPLEQRADSREDLHAIVLTVLVDQVAQLLGVAPESVHPDYLS